MSQETHQQIWNSLTPDEMRTIFAFIDSDINGVSKALLLLMLQHMQVPNETLDTLVQRQIVEVGDDEGEHTQYKMTDPDFYNWICKTILSSVIA